MFHVLVCMFSVFVCMCHVFVCMFSVFVCMFHVLICMFSCCLAAGCTFSKLMIMMCINEIFVLVYAKKIDIKTYIYSLYIQFIFIY